ncbi:GDP-L-fucose synthase [Polynucleobacter paneuropaeus]|nr:GDP-L-fucose synthase [Polynucleobacter paneuropaeus]MBT8587028.1 GDP-L-fucose synthase [Polynucleobacter paneuropaeus]MBT8599696.1 GDP-L-fucose synthase [Polynucleobacter paneuropaeus]
MTELLITGSEGLVGTALRNLDLKGARYIARKDVDLTNFNAVRDLFLELRPQKIIHLAAQVGGIGGNLMHSGEYFRNNILINTNVLESARLAGCDRLISYMSTCVFPDKCEYPLNEKSLHNGPPHPSNFGYAYAKRMLEVQSTAYRKEWGCNYVVSIPTNIYGPGDNFNLTEGHVVPALIHRIFLAKQNNIDLEVWGTGKPLREFVYSADIAKLSIWAINNYNEEAPIIFTSGIESSIRELVEMVARVMKFKGKIIFNEDKPDGQFRKPSDGTKLKSYLPDFKWTPLDEGIELTVDWFLTNYQTLRK